MKHQTSRRLIIAFVLIIALVSVNTWAQLYLTVHPHNAVNAAAYTGVEWYTPQFRTEQASLGTPAVWNDGGWYQAPDLHGKYFNAADGKRQTVGNPARWDHTLYLFGDSVMFGYTVPDAYTIASQLQASLPHDRVINLGVPGTTTLLAYNRLKALPLQSGDIVVYYGGVSESRAIYDEAQREVENSPLSQLCGTTTLATLQLLCRQTTDTVSLPLLQDNARLKAALTQLQADYIKNTTAMQAYAQRQHVQFISILEPYQWTMPPTNGERSIWVDANLQYADVTARPYEQTAIRDVAGVDFTHVLDAERQQGIEFYTDTIHLNSVGNRFVASAILKLL